jgi:hypothetical protein
MSDYFYLCGNCGEITEAKRWGMFHYTEGGYRRPPEPNESDPVLECPVCFYEFTDDDSGPPMYDGHSREECERQRQALLDEAFEEYGFDWGESWTAVRADLAAGKIVKWEPLHGTYTGAPVSERVRIVGDHPHRGKTGTVRDDLPMRLGMWQVELDPGPGIGGPRGCFADPENLWPLARGEDPR